MAFSKSNAATAQILSSKPAMNKYKVLFRLFGTCHNIQALSKCFILLSLEDRTLKPALQKNERKTGCPGLHYVFGKNSADVSDHSAITSIPIDTYLPSPQDEVEHLNAMRTIVKRILVTWIPFFHSIEDTVE